MFVSHNQGEFCASHFSRRILDIIIIIILLLIILLICEFFTSSLVVFHWSLSDRKSPQVSWTLLSILADLNYTVLWMVYTRPLFSKSSNPCTNPLMTVPSDPITSGITVTFMFHIFSARKQGLDYYYYRRFCKNLDTGIILTFLIMCVVELAGKNSYLCNRFYEKFWFFYE